MNLEEIKKYLDENKDKEEVKSFVQGLYPVTLDKVKAFVQNDAEGRSWFDSEKDKHSAKSLETWKTNNLESLLDTEIKKRFPEKDPKDLELEKIKNELENIKREKEREILRNKAIKIANEKKLPLDLVDYFISEDEEKTTANLTKFEKIFSNHIQTEIENRLKSNSYTPPGDDNNKKTDYSKMSMEEYARMWQEKNK